MFLTHQILDACVKTLPDDSQFGVVTVSDRVGLVNLSAPLPHIQFVDLGLRSDHGGGGAAGEGGVGGAGTQLPRDSWPDSPVSCRLALQWWRSDAVLCSDMLWHRIGDDCER